MPIHHVSQTPYQFIELRFCLLCAHCLIANDLAFCIVHRDVSTRDDTEPSPCDIRLTNVSVTPCSIGDAAKKLVAPRLRKSISGPIVQLCVMGGIPILGVLA